MACPAPTKIVARFVCAVIVAAALLAGCAEQPVPNAPAQAAGAAEAKASAPAAAEEQPLLPHAELSESILYELLLAEVAGQRGNADVAAQAYADLAKQTRDPRIARRATEIALFAHMNALAVDSARIWHETDPQSKRALQLLSGLLVNAGRLPEAEPYLKQFLSAEGTNVANAFVQLSRTLGTAQDKEAALRAMQSLAAGYEQVPQAHYAVAQAAALADHPDVALKELHSARELKPDWDAPVLLEAQVLQKSAANQALATLSGYLERYPDAREVRLTYARMLVAEKRYADARGQFQRLLADFPGNADVVYAVALLSVQLNDYALAEENLQRLLGMDYRDKDSVRLYLGQIAEEQNKRGEALKWYGSVPKGEQFIPAQIRYAQLLAKDGKLEEAREHLHKLQAAGGRERVQLTLAEAQLLRDANRDKEAFDFVGKALDADPDQPELLYDYAMLAERMDRMDLLESSLRKVIKIRPDYAHAYNALGYSLAERNMRLPEARELIQQALKLAPEDSFIIDSMGWVLYRMGNLQEALTWLRKAFTERPDPEIAAHLGEVLWVTGDRGTAEKVWREATDKSPKNEVLTKTIERLKR